MILKRQHFSLFDGKESPLACFLWSYNQAGYLTGYQRYTKEGTLIEEMQISYDRIRVPSELAGTLIEEIADPVQRLYYQGSQFYDHS